MLRRLLSGSKIRPTLLHFYPYVLYFAMELTLWVVDVVTGINADAGGSVTGWYVFKVFVFAIVGLVLSGIFYPMILKLQKTEKKQTAYLLFVTLNYPVEYLFFSLPLLILQAENLPAMLRAPGFSILVVILSAWFANFLRTHIGVRYRDLRQRVYEEGFIRFASVFILVFIIIMLFAYLSVFFRIFSALLN